MSGSTRYQAIVDFDVTNSQSEMESRQAIFKSLSSQESPAVKRGRPSSGSTTASAAITGITIRKSATSESEVGLASADIALYVSKSNSGSADVIE